METDRREYHVKSFLYLFLSINTTYAARNIALNRIAVQSSETNINRRASNAVDNCVDQTFKSGCCTHTLPGQLEAWWWVDLGTRSAIDHINIFYRVGYEHRLAGYKLYVSNTTDRSQGVLCYQDTSSSLAEVANIQRLDCPYVGQYVIIYNERKSPCQPVWYSDAAILELCEVQVIGCPVGTYGDGDCATNCSSDCLTNSCSSTSGSCFYCPQERYGDFCEVNCSLKCKDRICFRDTGYCANCVSEKYGESCDEDCSSNCKDQICEKDTGHCLDCIVGKYGPTCEQTCPAQCENPICEKENGYCSACIHGFYGDMCDKNCPDTCEDPICEFKSGTCGDCKLGYYGFRCNNTCNSNCKGNECKQTDGACEEGCQDGTYGLVCDQDCSSNCKSNICHRLNGTCLECHDGQYGDTCEFSCPKNCERNICERNCGVCGECTSSTTIVVVLGCVASFLGMVSLVIVILRLRPEVKAGKLKEPHYAELRPVDRESEPVYEMST